MSSPVNNNINDTAYNNIQKATVHASKDGNKDEKVSLQESGGNSIFSQTETNMNAELDKAINNSARLSQDIKSNANTKSIVQKYLGNTSFSTLMNKFSSFSDIAYKAVELNDSETTTDVQNQIDTLIDNKISAQVTKVNEEVTSAYTKALENALKQAENELVGDKDLQNQDGSNTVKDDNYKNLKNISYHRPTEETTNKEHTDVSTFNSSAKGAENQSKGYQSTVAYLEANGAKAKTKLVNGQEQTVYKIKDDQGTRYVTVDDAGQVHDLDKNKGFLRSSKFTTTDSVQVAKEDARINGDKGLANAKVKVRNVDGQKQSVLTWKDDNGQKHSRVIDHDNQSGLSSSMEVHQVNAGGRAKYASDVSGLGALANKDANDDIKFNDSPHRFQNGTWTDETGETHADNVTTQHGRMKLDKANTGSAVDSIVTSAVKSGATATQQGDITEIKFPNGRTYTIDKSDNVSANKTMRLVQAEIGRTQQLNVRTNENTVTADTSKIVEDGRADTNLRENHVFEKWSNSSGNVLDVGVNSPQNHTPSAGGKGKVNSVRYGSNISRAQFAQEGWKASAGRTAENDILAKMDSAEVKGNEKSVRNLKTSEEFATRFLKAKGLDAKNYDTKKLAAALADANPSFFDSQGNMYRNADFSRLNLPKKLERYEA